MLNLFLATIAILAIMGLYGVSYIVFEWARFIIGTCFDEWKRERRAAAQSKAAARSRRSY